MPEQRPIKGFRDLDVYNTGQKACITVIKEILPLLPEHEKDDLRDQLSRSCKAVPRLISEGYGKRHQKRGFQKYLDDAHTETNETIASIEQCKNIYNIKPVLCEQFMDTYDKISRQIYKLAVAWDQFTSARKILKP